MGFLAPRSTERSIDWNLESKLPLDFKEIKRKEQKTGETKAIFLTGATGFLGPVLIQEILLQYDKDVKVYCLVRGESNEIAQKRLIAELKAAQVWDDSFESRLIVWTGNLGKIKFGLSEIDYQTLVERISDIYHNGAWVNLTIPYSGLKSTNVNGTIEAIRLALESHARLHYISTVGSLGSGDPNVNCPEDFVKLDEKQMNQKDGYGQTKAVAERLIYNAIQTYPNLDVRVFRPAAISGDARTGFSNKYDFINLLIQACIMTNLSVKDATTILHWIPVDFVAKSIVTLSRHPETKSKVFHLVGNGPSFQTIFETLTDYGYNLVSISSDNWKKKLPSYITEDNKVLYPIKNILVNYNFNVPVTSNVVLPTAKTREFLHTCGIAWAVVTKEDIIKCLQYLVSHNFLPSPSSQ